MIRRNPTCSASPAQTAQIKVEEAQEENSCSAVSHHPIDDLLRAFSDVAYSQEEDSHSWESWNYNRLSAF